MTEGQALFLILTMNTSYHQLVAVLAKPVGLVSVLGLIALSTGCNVTRSLSTGCMMTLVYCTGCTTMAIPHKKTHGDMTVSSKRIVMSLVLTADVVKTLSTDRIRLHTPVTYHFKAESIPNNLVLEKAEIYQNRCSRPGDGGEAMREAHSSILRIMAISEDGQTLFDETKSVRETIRGTHLKNLEAALAGHDTYTLIVQVVKPTPQFRGFIRLRGKKLLYDREDGGLGERF